MDQTVFACVDRIENNFLVCYTDDDACYLLPANQEHIYKGGERVLLTLSNNIPVSIKYLEKETIEAKKRVHSLFQKLLRKK